MVKADGEKMKSACIRRVGTTFKWALTVAALGLLSCGQASTPGFGGNTSGSGTGGPSSGKGGASSGVVSGSESGATSSGSGYGTADSGGSSGSGSGSSGTGRSGSGSGSSSGSGSGSSSGGSSGSSSGPPPGNGCGQTLPALSDYSKPGAFTATAPNGSTGPGNAYTVVQPTTLGKLNGSPFKHPIITWGNGI